MVCYGCHPDYCICPQPEDEVSLMGRRSPRPCSQTAYHGQQRTQFDRQRPLRLGRDAFDNLPVNHAPPSSSHHHPDTLRNDQDPFATDFHNIIHPSQPPCAAAHGQRGRDPHVSYNFSSSNRTFTAQGTNRAGTTINYSGFQDEDDQRPRPPIKSSSTRRARSSSSDSFVYDVGLKSVQDARRRAARRDRDRDRKPPDPSGLPLDSRFERSSVNSQSEEDFHLPSFRHTAPTTRWRKQVCYGCTPGDCICPTVSDDSA